MIRKIAEGFKVLSAIACTAVLIWAGFTAEDMFPLFIIMVWGPGVMILIVIYTLFDNWAKSSERKDLNKRIEAEIKRSEEYHRLNNTL